MEAKTSAAKPTAVKWDEYFPLLNKAILGLLLCGAIMIASGVDLVQIGSKILGGGDDAEAVVAADVGEPVASDFGRPSKPATGIAAWRNVIIAIAAMLSVVVLVFYVLSVGGRDAAWMKEQQQAAKKEQKPNTPAAASAQENDSEECNLASYKLFYSSESAAGDKS